MRLEGDIVIPASMLVRKKAAEGEEEKLRELNMVLALWYHFGAVEIRNPGPVYDSQMADIFQLPSFTKTNAQNPDKLLNPPWTESKVEFLHLLSPGAYVDEDVSDKPRSYGYIFLCGNGQFAVNKITDNDRPS